MDKSPAHPALAGLSISDPPERWAALGFAVDDAGETVVGGVRLVLGLAPPGHGIVGWALRGTLGDLGLATTAAGVHAPAAVEHPNGAVAVDHVVIATPGFEAFASAVTFRRVAERDGRRQGFLRIGGPILEVVEVPESPGPRFWGVTFTTVALDRLVDGSRFVGDARPAVQPGRRIATVAREAGLSTRVAFMDPEGQRS